MLLFSPNGQVDWVPQRALAPLGMSAASSGATRAWVFDWPHSRDGVPLVYDMNRLGAAFVKTECFD